MPIARGRLRGDQFCCGQLGRVIGLTAPRGIITEVHNGGIVVVSTTVSLMSPGTGARHQMSANGGGAHGQAPNVILELYYYTFIEMHFD